MSLSSVVGRNPQGTRPVSTRPVPGTRQCHSSRAKRPSGQALGSARCHQKQRERADRRREPEGLDAEPTAKREPRDDDEERSREQSGRRRQQQADDPPLGHAGLVRRATAELERPEGELGGDEEPHGVERDAAIQPIAAERGCVLGAEAGDRPGDGSGPSEREPDDEHEERGDADRAKRRIGQGRQPSQERREQDCRGSPAQRRARA